MAEVTIRFRFNRKTGHKEMVISYESEEDALPHEHERDHRALAEQLLGRKLDEDDGEIIVERVTKKQPADAESAGESGARKAHEEKG
jgi:hypothetical protein